MNAVFRQDSARLEEGMSVIHIRYMQTEDVERVCELERQIFSCPWTKKGFDDSLGLACTVFLTAEENGKIVGYAGMYTSLDEAEITNVAVKKEERRRGIGGLLVQRLKEEAAKRGIVKIVLEVRVSNEGAYRLYGNCGFQKCGVRKNFYEAPKEDAYLMIYEK